ncbi:MAG: glycerol-3-phosphate acyltransferase [Spirochaetota bacterium]
MNVFVAAIVAYVIGSFSPSYVLGRVLKRIDIREHGDGNAGTINVTSVLGFVPGAIVAVIDASKGIIALYISMNVFNVEGNLLLLSIFSTLAGHIFPFYLRFRGGQGAATATCLLLYFLATLLYSGRLPLNGLLILAVITVIALYVLKSGESVGIIILPLFLLFVLIYMEGDFPFLIVSFLTAFLFGVTLYNFIKKRRYLKGNQIKTAWWATASRLSASLIIPFYAIFGRTPALTITGIAVVIFGGFDIFRLVRQKNGGKVISQYVQIIFSGNKRHRFALLSLFFVAAFAIILIFPKDIALLSLSFLIGGGIFAHVLGLRFGKNRLIRGISVEECLAYFAGSLAAGYIVSTLSHINLLLLITGAVASALAELLAAVFDDNLPAGILSGAAMSALRYFIKV